MKTEAKKVTVTHNMPFSPKMIGVIKSMGNGAIIEKCNGLAKCDGVHLTQRDLKLLNAFKMVKVHSRIGNYTVCIDLTDNGKQIADALIAALNK